MIEYIRLRLTFEALSDLQLTFFKGSTLRSLFKTSLRNVCCIGSRNQECKGCICAGTCPYVFLTEHKTETGEDTVLPLAVSCASIERNGFQKGERFSFDMALVGKAINILPYAVASLSNWERHDLGRFQVLISGRDMVGRADSRFRLQDMLPWGKVGFVRAEQVTGNGLRHIYEPGGVFRQPEIQSLSINEKPSPGMWTVTVRFLSPVRIFRKLVDPATGRKKKTLVTPDLFSFEIFFRALRKRIVELARHFGESPLELPDDQNERIWQAVAEVTMNKTDGGLEMLGIRRYNRSLDRYKLYDGLIGAVEFKNVSGCLVPWIMAGEILQVGKFPAMGYGEYRCEFGNQEIMKGEKSHRTEHFLDG
ncbi:MAG: CRISPR system precrRNA processing endoribonuclease RAMP protein Cas6 [Desulfobacteraceae bacterium]|nr:MAG: CRISPR system precrRNA processing endoribonuclease RAMP protein Cas6 [Desulfobacteraceae bacterium]